MKPKVFVFLSLFVLVTVLSGCVEFYSRSDVNVGITVAKINTHLSVSLDSSREFHKRFEEIFGYPLPAENVSNLVICSTLKRWIEKGNYGIESFFNEPSLEQCSVEYIKDNDGNVVGLSLEVVVSAKVPEISDSLTLDYNHLFSVYALKVLPYLEQVVAVSESPELETKKIIKQLQLDLNFSNRKIKDVKINNDLILSKTENSLSLNLVSFAFDKDARLAIEFEPIKEEEVISSVVATPPKQEVTVTEEVIPQKKEKEVSKTPVFLIIGVVLIVVVVLVIFLLKRRK